MAALMKAFPLSKEKTKFAEMTTATTVGGRPDTETGIGAEIPKLSAPLETGGGEGKSVSITKPGSTVGAPEPAITAKSGSEKPTKKTRGGSKSGPPATMELRSSNKRVSGGTGDARISKKSSGKFLFKR